MRNISHPAARPKKFRIDRLLTVGQSTIVPVASEFPRPALLEVSFPFQLNHLATDRRWFCLCFGYHSKGQDIKLKELSKELIRPHRLEVVWARLPIVQACSFFFYHSLSLQILAAKFIYSAAVTSLPQSTTGEYSGGQQQSLQLHCWELSASLPAIPLSWKQLFGALQHLWVQKGTRSAKQPIADCAEINFRFSGQHVS